MVAVEGRFVFVFDFVEEVIEEGKDTGDEHADEQRILDSVGNGGLYERVVEVDHVARSCLDDQVVALAAGDREGFEVSITERALGACTDQSQLSSDRFE